MKHWLRHWLLLVLTFSASSAVAEDFPFYCQSFGQLDKHSFTVRPSVLSSTGYLLQYRKLFADSDSLEVRVTRAENGELRIDGSKLYPLMTKHFRAKIRLEDGEGNHQFGYSFERNEPVFPDAMQRVFCELTR